VATANRPVNQLLDLTESIVDRILPPELEMQPVQTVDDESEQEISGEAYEEECQFIEDPHTVNPITRLKKISSGVPKRLVALASEKLTPQQTEILTYIVSILKHTINAVNLDETAKLLYENAASVQSYLDEKKENVVRLVQPAKEIIEQQTADIKDLSVKTLVTIVSTVSHVTEIIRKQFLGRVLNMETLHEHLAEVIRRTKEAVLKLKDPERNIYLHKCQDLLRSVLHSLIELTQAYTPEKFLSLFLHLSNLSSWRFSDSHKVDYQKTNS